MAAGAALVLTCRFSFNCISGDMISPQFECCCFLRIVSSFVLCRHLSCPFELATLLCHPEIPQDAEPAHSASPIAAPRLQHRCNPLPSRGRKSQAHRQEGAL